MHNDYAFQLLLGGEVNTAPNPIVRNNYTYLDTTKTGGVNTIGYNGSCDNPHIIDNYFAHGSTTSLALNCTNISMAGNTFYGSVSGFNSGDFPDNDYLSTKPSGIQTFVRPNLYETGRGHIVVYNWPQMPNVHVDVSTVLSVGQEYEVLDVENYFGNPIASGTYTGAPISIPMTSTEVAEVIGADEPPHTSPEFGVFVLIGGSIQDDPDPTPTPSPALGPATPANTGSSSVTTTLSNPGDPVTTTTGSSVSPIFPTVRLVRIPTGEAEISGALQLEKKLQFAGQAPANGIVSIRLINEAGRTVPGVAKVDGSGNWSWNPPSNLQSGEYTATFTVQDHQGSSGRTTLTFSIDEDGEPRVIESLQETDVSPGTEEVVSEPRSLWDDLIDFFRGLSQNFSSLVGMR